MTKVAGFNGFLKRNTTGSTYVTINQIMSLSEVGDERSLIDASAHGDPYADFVVGRREGTVVELVLAFDPADAQHTALFTDYTATTPTSRLYELQHASFLTHAVRFPGLPTKWSQEATDDGVYEMHFEMKIVSPGPTIVTPS